AELSRQRDQRPGGPRLDRPRSGDVVVPDRTAGRDQLPLRRHGDRGASRHRTAGAPRDLALQRHPAGHHVRHRQRGTGCGRAM
ncbi:MAG: hypothetical protein AVDCRST_MAG47-2555, partial [uncultured Nocardioidaceae bacterium]